MCFECGNRGTIGSADNRLLKDRVVRCSECPRFFHLGCLKQPKPTDIEKRIICQSHFCKVCSDFSKKLLKCLRCTASYHKECLSRQAKVLHGLWIDCNCHSKKPLPVKRLPSETPKLKLPSEETIKAYQELSLPAPADFDYANSTQPWCRYCGARYSDKFGDTELGRGTLCAKHMKIPKRNGLNNSAPLHPEKNTELNFLLKK